MAINKKLGDILELSNLSEYLSHTDSNGVLRLWDSTLGVLRQEYVSSGHLTSRYHCLAWCPAPASHSANNTPKKKRKRISKLESIGSLQLLAMGISTGSILIYSVKIGDLYKTLTGGHDDVVTGVCWSEKGDHLYSCSSDGSVVCWDVEAACVESKWMTDSGLSSICLCSSQNHLLTAGRAIHVWDLESKTSLQSFQGHTTDVLKVIEICCNPAKLMNGCGVGHDDKLSGIKESYILSMAADENKISVRQIASACKDLLASFTLPNQPSHFDIITPNRQLLQMVVVTKNGSMAYFECHLNSRHKKPMKPKIVTTIMTNSNSKNNTNNTTNSSSKCLPILIAKLLQGDTGGGGGAGAGTVVCVLYGDVQKPAFERINISDLKKNLVREDPRSCKISVEESVVKIKTPTIGSDVLLLSSSSVQAVRQDGNDARPSRKRKKSFSLSQNEVTLGEQLSQMTKQQSTEINSKASSSSSSKLNTTSTTTKSSSSPITTQSTTTPLTIYPTTTILPSTSSAKTDSLAILLGQGLQSSDKKILNNVLQKVDYQVIRKTVAKLPSQCIHALVRELSRRISGHAQSGKSAVRWMKALLSIHSSYLTTIPDIEELLNPLVDYLEPSLEVLTKMMILKGKLDCMATQLTMLSAPAYNQPSPSDPALATIDPIDEEDDDVTAEDVRYLDVSDEDEWEDATETAVTNTKDSNSSHKTSDFSDAEGSGDDTLMEAD